MNRLVILLGMAGLCASWHHPSDLMLAKISHKHSLWWPSQNSTDALKWTVPLKPAQTPTPDNETLTLDSVVHSLDPVIDFIVDLLNQLQQQFAFQRETGVRGRVLHNKQLPLNFV